MRRTIVVLALVGVVSWLVAPVGVGARFGRSTMSGAGYVVPLSLGSAPSQAARYFAARLQTGATGASGEWGNAARELQMPLMRPTNLSGLAQSHFRVEPKNGSGCAALVDAEYESGGDYVMLHEGRQLVDEPPCGNLGAAPPPSELAVGGSHASFYDYCNPAWLRSDPMAKQLGCPAPAPTYELDFREHGVEVAITSGGVSKKRLLALASGLVVQPLVPGAHSGSAKKTAAQSRLARVTRESNALTNLLPFTGPDSAYKITYVYKFSYDAARALIIVTAPNAAGRQEAIAWLKHVGFNPSDLNISFVTAPVP